MNNYFTENLMRKIQKHSRIDTEKGSVELGHHEYKVTAVSSHAFFPTSFQVSGCCLNLKKKKKDLIEGSWNKD